MAETQPKLAAEELNGKTVLVDPTTGLVQLRDSNGRVFGQKREYVEQDLESGKFFLAGAPDVNRYDADNTSLGEQALTAGEGFVRRGLDIGLAGARDVLFGNSAAALGMGEKTRAEELLGDVTGARAMGAAAGLGAEAGLWGEGQTLESADTSYQQSMRERAERNPWSSFAGGMGAELGWSAILAKPMVGAGLVGPGSTLATRAGAAALEGAHIGAGLAGEDAFIQDREITSEATLAATGLGAVLSAGAVLGLEGLGYAGKKLWRYRKGGKIAAGGADAALTTRELDDAYQALAERAQVGKVPDGFGAKLRRLFAGDADEGTRGIRGAIYDVKAADAGLDTAGREMLERAGPLTLGDDAARLRADRSAREALTIDATRKTMAELDEVRRLAQDVTRETVETELKRANVARNLAGMSDDAARIARETTDQALDEVQERLARRVAETRAERLGEEVIPGVTPRKVSNRPIGEVDRINRELGRIRKAAQEAADSGDLAEYYVKADHARRILGDYAERVNAGQHLIQDAGKRRLAELDAEAATYGFERLRQHLQGTAWGEQGVAQAAVNDRWVRYIQAQRAFAKEFLELNPGAPRDFYTGLRNFQTNQARTYSFLQKVGTFEAEPAERAFREFLDAAQDIAEAHGSQYALAEGKQAAVKALAERVGTTRGLLDGQVKRLAEVNLLDEVIAKTSGRGVFGPGVGAVGGAVIGGPVGAAVGGIMGVATDFGRMWRVTASLEANAGRTLSTVKGRGKDIVRGMVRLKDAAAGGVKTAAHKTEHTAHNIAEKTLHHKGHAALMPGVMGAESDAGGAGGRAVRAGARQLAFRRSDESKREAYERRIKELREFTAKPEQSAQKLKHSLEGIEGSTPKLAGHMALKASMAAAYLIQKAPVPGVQTRSLTPHLSKVTSVSDREIDKWAAAWEGVNAPLSLLDDLESGRISAEKVEAVKANYPRLFQEMQMAIMEGLRTLDEPVPYQGRVRLDLMFDLNGAAETSLSPEFLQRGAQAYAEHVAAAQADQQQRAGRSGGTASFADDYQTTAQRIAQ